MINLVMPPQSFDSKEEVSQLPNIIAKNAHLMKQIHDDIEVMVIGRKMSDIRFWESDLMPRLKEKDVLDPYDNKPINIHRKITHLAVVVIYIDKAKEHVYEFVYGNTSDNLFEFVRAVLVRTIDIYPRLKVR